MDYKWLSHFLCDLLIELCLCCSWTYDCCCTIV